MKGIKMRWALMLVAAVALGALMAVAAEQKESEEQEVKVTLDQVPAAVKAAIEKEAHGGKVNEIEKDTEDGKTVYEAEIAVGQMVTDVKFAEDGKILERESADEDKDEKKADKDDEDEDENEVELTLDQAPAAVKATLEAEAKGGKIEEIVKVTEDGKTGYEADVIVNGKKTEIDLSEDGKVIKREADDEDEDEDEAEDAKAGKDDAAFIKTFGEDKADLATTGKNDYFILEPGYALTLQGGDETLVITVLDETRDVDGVKTRVVEERETKGGNVAEVSRNYFAISKKTNNIYYFGEESIDYKDGKEAGRSGSWEAGRNGAQFGMIMPAKPKPGEKYYQEIAPKEKAMDRAETVSLQEKVTVPAGTFENCLKVRESSATEGGSEFKLYAPGVGLLADEDLKLVKYGFGKKP